MRVAKLCFCSTGLPLARTRWVRSTLSSHCPLTSDQVHWFTSATAIIFPLKKIVNAGIQSQGCWVRSKYATSVQCSPLCHEIVFFNPDANVSTDIVGDLRVDDEPGRLLRHHRPLLLRARPTGSWLPWSPFPVLSRGWTSPTFLSLSIEPGRVRACPNVPRACFEPKLFTNKNYKIQCLSLLWAFLKIRLGPLSLSPGSFHL